MRSHVLVVALVHRAIRDHRAVRIRQPLVVVRPPRPLGALEPERYFSSKRVPDPDASGVVARHNLVEPIVPQGRDAPRPVARVRLRLARDQGVALRRGCPGDESVPLGVVPQRSELIGRVVALLVVNHLHALHRAQVPDVHALANVQRHDLVHVVQHQTLENGFRVAHEDLLRSNAERVPQVDQPILAAADQFLVPRRPAHRVYRLAPVPVEPSSGISERVILAINVGEARQSVAAAGRHAVELFHVKHGIDPTVVNPHAPYRLVSDPVAAPRGGRLAVGHVDHPPHGHVPRIVAHREVIAVLVVDDTLAPFPRRRADRGVLQAPVGSHVRPAFGVVDLDLAVGARDEHALRRG